MKAILQIVLVLRRFYWWIARPETQGVRAIVTNDRGQILLVQHKYGTGWYLPGGKAGRNENLEDALKRELEKEVGISSFSIDCILGTYTNVQEYKKDIITVYALKEVKQSDVSHFEIETVSYFDTDQLPESTSPGTKRRIQEFLRSRPVETDW